MRDNKRHTSRRNVTQARIIERLREPMVQGHLVSKLDALCGRKWAVVVTAAVSDSILVATTNVLTAFVVAIN